MKQKHHKNHKGDALPHLNDAANQETGVPDLNALKAGAAAWFKALEDGDYEITSVSEIAADDDLDVLVIARKKVAK